MTCEQAEPLLADFFRGALDAPAKAEVLGHLSECASCKEAAEFWNTLGAELGGAGASPGLRPGRVPDQAGMAWDAEQPSSALRARIDMMVDAFRAGAQKARPAPRSPWTWLRAPIMQFGLAAACLVVGLGIGLLLRTQSGSAELNMLREEIHGTRQMVALALLQQQSASSRLQGVNYAYQLHKPDAAVTGALLDALRHDPSIDVRLASLDALQKVGNYPALKRDLMASFSDQKSPLVQLALVDLFSESRDADSRTFVQNLAHDQSLESVVRERIDYDLRKQ